jgi:hypothetical protein
MFEIIIHIQLNLFVQEYFLLVQRLEEAIQLKAMDISVNKISSKSCRSGKNFTSWTMNRIIFCYWYTNYIFNELNSWIPNC